MTILTETTTPTDNDTERLSFLEAFYDRLLEAGWLLSIVIAVVFFNTYSSRVFQVDKAAIVRALATVMAAVWVARLCERWARRVPPLRFSWRTPLVLAALLVLLSNLVSTLFSVSPDASFWGSYGRLQGMYTLSAYFVIFLSILTSLRTQAQLSRLVTTLIVASVPVTTYGLYHYLGFDPLPWAGVGTPSTLGVPEYVFAYLLIMMPLTLSRVGECIYRIGAGKFRRGASIVRGLGYACVAALQFAALFYNYSGMRYMAGWGEELYANAWKIRPLIWQGAFDLALPHAPLQYPDGHLDAFNAVRPLIGYGPETMYAVYGRFYRPELGRYEARTATPDMAKNATLDALANTGILGLAAYLFFFGSLFYHSLRWLGLIATPEESWGLVGATAFGALALSLLLGLLAGWHFVGIAIPAGMLLGLVLYVVVRVALSPTRAPARSESRLHASLLTGILLSVVAYFVATNLENNFTTINTLFWVLAALLVVLGQGWITGPTTGGFAYCE